jgi:hypothetical protein
MQVISLLQQIADKLGAIPRDTQANVNVHTTYTRSGTPPPGGGGEGGGDGQRDPLHGRGQGGGVGGRTARRLRPGGGAAAGRHRRGGGRGRLARAGRARRRAGQGDRRRSGGAAKLGWNIVAGKNDKIDFNRGGVKVATITAGSYTTGAALAAAVVTAMTAADGGATWTCSYAANTFTVGANLAFVLLFGSGTNLATSAAKELGFAVSDTGSATSQVAGNVSNHTREWVDIDLGTSQQIGGAAIASTT